MKIKMPRINRRNVITAMLSMVLSLISILGWQISMDYGSSFFREGLGEKIGVMPVAYCLLLGVILFVVYFRLLTKLFLMLNRYSMPREIQEKGCSWFVWGIVLSLVWFVLLWGCYPGYYNYDGGNQLVQVLYDEVPYNAHHPLLHTLFEGGIITLGYRLRDVDLTFGIFLHSVIQMFLCALCLGYGLHFVWERTGNKVIAMLSFLFYAFCPPIVMFAMSTTKDVLCYATLVVAIVHMTKLIGALQAGEKVSTWRWMWAGAFLSLSVLIRKNNVYAVFVFAFLSVMFLRREWKKQSVLYLSVILIYFGMNTGLEYVLHATPGSVNEALCVPYQAMARLYNEKGETAFEEEELELLSAIIPLYALGAYDPVMGDHTKANFYPGLETLLKNKGDYAKLWVRKGIQYPGVFLESLLYNTYQAWYPWTGNYELRGNRYFMLTEWQEEHAKPTWPGLYSFYAKVAVGEYEKWPIVRLLFSTGTMFCSMLITWFYGMWRRDKSITLPYLFVFLVCGTLFLGPVADVRYYLHLFYLFPIGVALLLSGGRENRMEE